MTEIKEGSSKCIRCDREVQTAGPVEEREYRTLSSATGAYLLICNDCFEEVEGRSFA